MSYRTVPLVSVLVETSAGSTGGSRPSVHARYREALTKTPKGASARRQRPLEQGIRGVETSGLEPPTPCLQSTPSATL